MLDDNRHMCAGRKKQQDCLFGETGLCWLNYKKLVKELVTSDAVYFCTVTCDDLSIANPFSTPDFCSSSPISG